MQKFVIFLPPLLKIWIRPKTFNWPEYFSIYYAERSSKCQIIYHIFNDTLVTPTAEQNFFKALHQSIFCFIKQKIIRTNRFAVENYMAITPRGFWDRGFLIWTWKNYYSWHRLYVIYENVLKNCVKSRRRRAYMCRLFCVLWIARAMMLKSIFDQIILLWNFLWILSQFMLYRWLLSFCFVESICKGEAIKIFCEIFCDNSDRTFNGTGILGTGRLNPL